MSLLTIVSVINEDLSTDAATWPIALNSLDLRLYELHQPHEISQHLSPAFRAPSLGLSENHVLSLYQIKSVRCVLLKIQVLLGWIVR